MLSCGSFILIASLSLTVAVQFPEFTGRSASPSTVAPVKPKVIRTELRVGRNMNWGDTELINVRGNNGELTQLVVKKRPSTVESVAPPVSDSINRYFKRATNTNDSMKLFNFPFVVSTELKSVEDADKQKPGLGVQRRPVQNFFYNIMGSLPESIAKSTVAVVEQKSDPKNESKPSSGSQISFAPEEIPTIEGVRVPDDEEDRVKVWRNARVIKNKLVPYKSGYRPARARPIHLIEVPHSESLTKRTGLGPFFVSDNIENVQTDYKRARGPFFAVDNIRSAEQFNTPSDTPTHFRSLENDDAIFNSRQPVREYLNPDVGVKKVNSNMDYVNTIRQTKHYDMGSTKKTPPKKVQYYTNLNGKKWGDAETLQTYVQNSRTSYGFVYEDPYQFQTGWDITQ